MKIAGKSSLGVNEEVVVIPRPSGVDADGKEVINDIPFKARAVLDFEPFIRVCPAPIPPRVKRVNGPEFDNVEDPNYKAAVFVHNQRRIQWMQVKSLEATPGLEWETIKGDDPNTWGNLNDELTAAGFNWREINLITDCVFKANALDDTKIDEAKKRFLAGQGQGRPS